MLPAELLAKYGTSGAYGGFLDWAAEGAKHPVYTLTAEQAADAAGLSVYADGYIDAYGRAAGQDGYSGGWSTGSHDWGENWHKDASGNYASIWNPARTSFIQKYMAEHPNDTGPTSQSAPNVGDPLWLAANAAPSPWATDDTPGLGDPGPDPVVSPFIQSLYDTSTAKSNDAMGLNDPMTISRQRQSDLEFQALLTQALGVKKKGGQRPVKNPFALGRAFGRG